jgi:uncharacterized protein (TIGR00369 family)
MDEKQKMNDQVPKALKKPPVAALVGFELVSAQDGQALIEFQAAKQHTNSFGILNGGVLCIIADSAMATAYATTLGPEETFTTVELKINFLKLVRNTKLRALGKVVSQNQTTALVHCEIVDHSEQLVAHATSTFLRSSKI